MPALRSPARRRTHLLIIASLLGSLLGAGGVPAADPAGKSTAGAKPAAASDVKPAAAREPGKTAGFAEATDRAKAAPTPTAKDAVKKAETPQAHKPVTAKPAEAVKTLSANHHSPLTPAPLPQGERGSRLGPKPNVPTAQPNPEPTAVDVTKDPDYAYQGEFVGMASATPSKYERVAVQIRPTGTGGFDAMQYPGGLPGEPTYRATAIPLVGKRWERFLVLSGGPWAIFVEPDHCTLFDRQGLRVGRLERVARHSPTLGALPPKDAIVLFDGKNTNLLTTARMTSEGLLMEGADARPVFQDFNLHVEFLLPYLPNAKDQGRANSGVYLQSRYEVQVLDSFALSPAINGCGAIYKFRKPDLNMCLPPRVWQTYDIAFTAPRWWADGTKRANGRVTVWLNGVKVQNNVELLEKTGAGKVEDPLPLPIRFQDHRNPVRFRNIWLVDRGLMPVTGFPVATKPADATPQAAQKPAAAPTASSAKPKTEKPATAPAKPAAPDVKPAAKRP
jgi:hypothetical protein